MFCLLLSVTLLICIVPRTKTQEIYYVAANTAGCPDNTTFCHEIDYYCAGFSAPLTNVAFHFLPGTHVLRSVCVIGDAVNISFQSAGEVKYNKNETSWQSDVIFQLEGSFGRFEIITGQYVTIDGISIIIRGPYNRFTITRSTAVTFINCHVTSTAVKSGEHVAPGSHGLSLYDCANVTISYSSFALMGDSGLFIKYDQLLNMETNYMKIHHTNFSYNRIAGLTIVGMAENYFPVSTELVNLLFTNNTHRSISILMLHCIGSIFMEGVVSSGPVTGLYFENTLPCRDTPPCVKVTNSVFESSRRFGIKMLIAPNAGTISFQNTTVRDVIGYQPIGIQIAQRPFQRLGTEPNEYSLRNMTIEGIYPTNYSLSTSQHAIGLSLIQLITIANVTIKNNIGTGLSLLRTVAELDGNITFYNNSAMEGGAIKLESSNLDANQYLNMEFIENKADTYGGAIHITNSNNNEEQCFFTNPVFQNVTLTFRDNTAGLAGSTMYGDLEACFERNGFETSFLINGQKGFDAALGCKQSIISSNEYRVYFCNENNCLASSTYEVEVIPGKPFTFEIIVVGELNGTTPALVKLTSGNFNSSIIIDVPSGPACTEETVLLRLARQTNLVNFSISVSEPTVNNYQEIPAWLAVHVLPCPVGFELVNGRCRCARVLTDLGLTCDILSTTWQKTEGTWIAPSQANDSTCIYFAEICSFDYCNQSNTNVSIGEPDLQCMDNRHGTLCGSCQAQYSLLLGSNRCANCTSKDEAWRIPVVVLGSAIAGIGLVALLVGLDLTVCKGTINGLVFFANVLKLYEASFALGQNTVIGVLISWVNLDLGIETCFYQGMDACGKAWLQFVFPLYVISLVLLFIILGSADQWKILRVTRLNVIISPLSKKATTFLGNRAVSVLATLFLLSYTKLIRTVILIFSKASIQCCDSSTDLCHHSYTTWYLDGNIRYFTGCHLFLVIVACILSVVIILFTTFLVMFPLLAENRLQAFECRGTWRLKLQPWFDAYGSPYKERYRFWVGLSIVVRCIMALVVALAPSNSAQLTALAWISLILIMVVAFLQVYKHRLLNALEVWYFAGLLILAYFGESSSTTGSTVGIYIIVTASLLIGLCVILHSLHIYLNLLSKTYSSCLTKIQAYFNCQERKKIYTFTTGQQFEKRDSAPSTSEPESSYIPVTIASIEDNDYREPQIAEDIF